jgi:hypothetical protein
MPLLLISAACLATAPVPVATMALNNTPPHGIGRDGGSESVSASLYQVHREVRSAYQKKEISPEKALELYVGIERIRRRTYAHFNFGYRERVRLRARIDAIRARLEESRTGSLVHSGNSASS